MLAKARSDSEVKRAAGYVRVSQVGDRAGDSFLSPELQREKIEAWAAYRDYRIVGWYVDLDRPASKGAPPRPEFERLMQDAREGAFEAIAVYRLTRFARSLSAAAAAYDELERLNVALVSVTEDIDTTTVAGNLMRNILFALAEFESQRIGEEWRSVHAARRRKGIAHVGRPMFGYQVAGGVVVGIDEAEATAVRTLYVRRSKGADLGELQAWISGQGFQPKRGTGTKFAKTTIRHMLRNPLYAGLVRTPDDELIEGQHPAIVPRDLYDQVQQTWKKTTQLARHRARSLLAGLVVCSGCEHRMAYEHAHARYLCKSRDGAWECPRPVSIKAPAAEEYVERLFLRRFDPKRMPHGGKLKRTRQQQKWQREAARWRSRVADLSRALDSLADQRYVQGSMQADEYERQFLRYMDERGQAEERADELEQMVAQVAPIEADVLLLWPNVDVETRRRALRLLIDRVVVKPAESRKREAFSPAKRLDIAWLR